MNTLLKFVSVSLASSLSALTSMSMPTSAHEFWISLERGRIAPGETITADLKVGQRLKGESYPYLSDRFRIFTRTVDGETSDIAGLEGDIPALASMADRLGLHVIAHQTVAFRVTYDDWLVFRRYLSDEGLDSFAEWHRSRGLPEIGFAERYTRTAKALVQVGPIESDDGDQYIGMPLELVAGTNPYNPGLDTLTVRLLWQGAPLANRQINVFHDQGDADTATGRAVFTDAEGRASISLSGEGEYLFNAVHLQPVEEDPVVWASHWATLSFKL